MALPGRQSLTRLAAFASELTCFQIELTRAYGQAEWRDDVKQLLLKAGLHMKETVFLFGDSQAGALRKIYQQMYFYDSMPKVIKKSVLKIL